MGKENATRYKDIAGQRFEHLTALYPLKERSKKRYVMWHCRCDCGNEADFSYNALMYSNLKSCGCVKQEHHQKMQNYLTRVDGTSLDRLKSTRINRNNTTGSKGVYFIRGKYVAKLVFQKKQYVLGTFSTLEEAAAVRREAEETIEQTVIARYARWKVNAEADPVWAQNNPVTISVSRDGAGQLRFLFRPKMK